MMTLLGNLILLIGTVLMGLAAMLFMLLLGHAAGMPVGTSTTRHPKQNKTEEEIKRDNQRWEEEERAERDDWELNYLYAMREEGELEMTDAEFNNYIEHQRPTCLGYGKCKHCQKRRHLTGDGY